MKRRAFLSLLSAALAAPAAAYAASFSDEVIAQLGKQGFTHISTETTWLGRIRILATRKDGQREIILNPRTGEILRDQWTANAADGAAAKPIIDDVGGSDDNGSDHGGSDDGGSESSSGSDGGNSDGGGSDGGSDSGSGSDHGGSSGSGSGSGDHGGSDDGGGGDKGKDD